MTSGVEGGVGWGATEREAVEEDGPRFSGGAQAIRVTENAKAAERNGRWIMREVQVTA